MDNHRRTKQTKTNSIVTSSSEGGTEVSSLEWEVVNMSQEEEDLVSRMHKLVGDRFDLLN
ncbi:Homeobox-like domain superfamily [Arabidopsis thaliana x Arabidopsis arenosa]|uniref:Homeobox-like domain superfamily n=1 Tax=Arabidopsis thaliana x Arabidopsis arenosa TaxID=1240361 RepID=A0A8T2DRT3_9BRAS|nr:Homeobox-like domain superfamily [Arabidopsis thaliana x Arabidopsis arenosa]